MRSHQHHHYDRKLLLDSEDDDDSPRNTGGSSFTSSRRPPLPSSSMATNPPFKPTLGFDSSMALTILVLLTALFFMVFFSMYLRRFAEDSSSIGISRRRRRNPSSSSSVSAATATVAVDVTDDDIFMVPSNGLDPSTIRSLPLFAYNGNTKGEPIDCSVCLSEFEEKETVKVIPYCGHVFHPECIDKWFSSHVSCPLCRSTQLFGVNSVKKEKEKCDLVSVNVSPKRFCCLERIGGGGVGNGISECESLGISMVGSGETSLEDEERKLEVSSGGFRRISSWSGLDEKVLLKRCSSF